MNEMVALRGVEPREILRTAIDKRVPAIMSYLSKGKWHVAKVILTGLGAERFRAESIHGAGRPLPINIQLQQPVGISFKYEYGKFIFDTSIVDLEPAQDSSGGVIVLTVPDRVEVVQRRSYFRVNVPESLKVSVVLWHRTIGDQPNRESSDSTGQVRRYYQGRLIDISAGGAQVVIDGASTSSEQSDSTKSASGSAPLSTQKPDFKEGQFVGMRFTPLPYETPLMFNAQIRHILPTADGRSICAGLQIVGLESSREGRQVLARLVGFVERYYRMNQPAGRPMQPLPRAV